MVIGGHATAMPDLRGDSLDSLRCSAVKFERVYDDDSSDKVPAIPSWDSGFSTVATIGELAGLEASIDAREVPTSCNFSRRGSLTSEASKESEDDRGVECQDLQQVSKFEDGFEKGRLIGDGAFGIVHRCVARGSGREFAVKVVEMEGLHPLDQTALQTEIRLHKALPAHDHIVSLHGSFEEATVMKLVMEMCGGGDLYIHLDDLKQRSRWKGGDPCLSERAAATVTRQLLSAVAFCHEHGIVHRDIKPGNILMAEPIKQVPLESGAAVIKLCDFGYATECRPEDPPSLREFVGSPDYLAPEVARREDYGCAVDVWAVGVVLFECLRGRVPFDADTDREIVKLVRKAEITFDDGWSRVSEQAQACVRNLMVEQVHQRPTADAALVHLWLMTQRP